MRIIDITNKRFGQLVAVKFSHKHKSEYKWLFNCDCGKSKIINKASVVHGLTTSCGCFHKKGASERLKTHGMKDTRFYRVWWAMIARCRYKSGIGWANYGGRGVEVCERWKKFENFRDDMFDTYQTHVTEHGQSKTSLDRINVDKGYSPDNCRWVTIKQQQRNKSNNRWITYNGKTQVLADWCEELNLRYDTVNSRLNWLGWSVEKAFTTPFKGA